MKAASIASSSRAAAGAARPARRCGGVKVVARATGASLVDATLRSDHWSGGSPLILPNGTVRRLWWGVGAADVGAAHAARYHLAQHACTPEPPEACTHHPPRATATRSTTAAQVMHSATHEQLEVIQTLQPMFEEHILPLLTPVDEMWQPTDFLPDSRDQDQFYQEVRGPGWADATMCAHTWVAGLTARGL